MNHLVTTEETRYVMHSDNLCTCGEPSPHATYCSLDCFLEAECKLHCDDCGEIYDAGETSCPECGAVAPVRFELEGV